MRPALRSGFRLAGVVALLLPAPATARQAAVGLANPASVHCARIGGQSQIRTGPQGQYGICVLPDGRLCEEWALLREARCLRPPD